MQRGRFQFFFANDFLENLVAWRLVALEGRLRGGKTLMSVALAKWLFDNGYVRGVFANFPIDPEYIPIVRSCVNTAVILDEGSRFADARDSMKGHKGYGAFFGKMSSYLITPSVFRVDSRMRPVACRRVMDWWIIDTWQYNWQDPEKRQGKFFFRGYRDLFPHYDHRFIPWDDGGILETMEAEIKELAGSMRSVYVAGHVGASSPFANPLEKK